MAADDRHLENSYSIDLFYTSVTYCIYLDEIDYEIYRKIEKNKQEKLIFIDIARKCLGT